MTDIDRLRHDGALAQARAIAQGAISARDLLAASLAAIDAENARLHAFIGVTAEAARADADHLDRLTRLGVSRGPLHGVPVAVKDIIDVAGERTRAGSITRDHVPAAHADAPVVRALRAAGAIVVGKTHTVEYAFGGWGTNVVAGTPVNPWDRAVHRTPGGSSSGSAVAVGAGLVPLAFGTDTGGSVRLPASWCGAVGHKTSLGLVSRAGVVPLVSRFDTIGPIARTVADAAVMAQAMLGADPADDSTAGAPPLDLLSGLDAGVAGLTIGVIEIDVSLDVDPDVRAAVEAAAKRLERAGARLRPVRMPAPLGDYGPRCGVLMSVEAYHRYGALAEETPCRLGAPVAARIRAGALHSAPAHFAAQERHRADRLAAERAVEGCDALLAPTCLTPAIPVADVDEAGLPGGLTRFVNYLDWCAVSVPVDPSPAGLPIGAQIIGRRYADALVLRIAAALEKQQGGPAPLPR